MYPNLSIKHHTVRPLKLNFLFLVLKMMKNDKVDLMVSQTQLHQQKQTVNIFGEEGETPGCRLCIHCGSMLASFLGSTSHKRRGRGWGGGGGGGKPGINSLVKSLVCNSFSFV